MKSEYISSVTAIEDVSYKNIRAAWCIYDLPYTPLRIAPPINVAIKISHNFSLAPKYPKTPEGGTAELNKTKAPINKAPSSLSLAKSFASIPAISGQVFSTSSKYVIYRYLEDHKYNNKFANGCIAGIISSIITHPLDVIKIHVQMRTPFISELKHNGLSLFYRGYSKTLSKVCVASSLFFPLNDTYLQMTENALVASFYSAVTSTIIMHPVDYLKVRHIYGLPLYDSKLNIISYYKGIGINLMRTVPHFMIVMSIIDKLNNTDSCATQ